MLLLRPWLAPTAALLLALALTPARGAAAASVTISDGGLQPAEIAVGVGEAVTWTNRTDRHFELTGPWGTVRVRAGASWSSTFSAPGSYAYRAETSSGRRQTSFGGTVHVGAASGTPRPGQPAPAPPPGEPAPAGAGTVAIVGRSFQPATLTVAAGATVIWTNADDRPHTVTSATGLWDSGTLASGATFRHSFAAAGSYPYRCELHPEMQGTINVTASGQPGPTATPTAVPAAAPPSPTPAAAPVPAGHEVSIADFRFQPETLVVPPGATVTWTNRDAARHTSTSEMGRWDSGLLPTGGRFSQTFDAPGSYPYRCDVHPEMRGTVVVAESESAAPTATATASPPATASATPPTGPPTPSPGQAPPAVVAGAVEAEIVDFGYEPSALRIAAGATVRWTNRGRTPHTVTAEDGAWGSEALQTGQAYERRFDAPGSYLYFCALHPNMRARVVVSATDAAPVAPASPAQVSGGEAVPASPPEQPAVAPPTGPETAPPTAAVAAAPDASPTPRPAGDRPTLAPAPTSAPPARPLSASTASSARSAGPDYRMLDLFAALTVALLLGVGLGYLLTESLRRPR